MTTEVDQSVVGLLSMALLNLDGAERSSDSNDPITLARQSVEYAQRLLSEDVCKCGSILIHVDHDADKGGHRFVGTRLKFRVWHIPQVPGSPFYRETATLEEALRLDETLGNFMLFLESEDVMPDYSNASGVEVWVPRLNEWEEYDEDDDAHVE